MIKVGILVKEKEGRRFGGLIIETKQIDEKRTDVLVLWTDGTRLAYKSTFLIPIV